MSWYWLMEVLRNFTAGKNDLLRSSLSNRIQFRRLLSLQTQDHADRQESQAPCPCPHLPRRRCRICRRGPNGLFLSTLLFHLALPPNQKHVCSWWLFCYPAILSLPTKPYRCRLLTHNDFGSIFHKSH